MCAAASSSTQKMPLSQKIGFVGGGQMALALAKGFIAAKLVAPEQILVSAPSDRNLKTWRDDMNCITTHDNAKVIEESDIIFLSTKVTRDNSIRDSIVYTILQDMDHNGFRMYS